MTIAPGSIVHVVWTESEFKVLETADNGFVRIVEQAQSALPTWCHPEHIVSSHMPEAATHRLTFDLEHGWSVVQDDNVLFSTWSAATLGRWCREHAIVLQREDDTEEQSQ